MAELSILSDDLPALAGLEIDNDGPHEVGRHFLGLAGWNGQNYQDPEVFRMVDFEIPPGLGQGIWLVVGEQIPGVNHHKGQGRLVQALQPKKRRLLMMLDEDVAMELGETQESRVQVDDLVRLHLNGAEITGFYGKGSRIWRRGLRMGSHSLFLSPELGNLGDIYVSSPRCLEVFLLDAPVNFFPENNYRSRGFDAQADLFASNLKDGDANVIPNEQALTGFSR